MDRKLTLYWEENPEWKFEKINPNKDIQIEIDIEDGGVVIYTSSGSVFQVDKLHKSSILDYIYISESYDAYKWFYENRLNKKPKSKDLFKEEILYRNIK